MDQKYLTGGRHQVIKLGGTFWNLWMDGTLIRSEDSEDTYDGWRGLGCLTASGIRHYFSFSTEPSSAHWVRDLEPTILLPLSFWPKDYRDEAPRIIEERKKELVTWFIDEHVCPVVHGVKRDPLPLPDIFCESLDYREALKRGFVYDPSGQRTLVLSGR